MRSNPEKKNYDISFTTLLFQQWYIMENFAPTKFGFEG